MPGGLKKQIHKNGEKIDSIFCQFLGDKFAIFWHMEREAGELEYGKSLFPTKRSIWRISTIWTRLSGKEIFEKFPFDGVYLFTPIF